MAKRKPAARATRQAAAKRTTAARASRAARPKKAAPAKKGARKAARKPVKKAAPAKRAPRKAAAKKGAARKVAPKKAALRKAVTRKAAPKKAAPKKVAPRKAAPKKAPVKKASSKAVTPRKAVPATPPMKAAPKKAAAAPPARARKVPALERARKTIADVEGEPSPPSSLDLDRTASAVRSGRHEAASHRREVTQVTPAITAGDVDADWEAAYTVGDEAPGGENTTPDQDVVDEIGQALGMEYADDEELHGEEKIAERDEDRWELDPESSEDFDERD